MKKNTTHLNRCWFCQEVLTQICDHSVPPAPEDAQGQGLSNDQQALLREVQRHLNKACQLLGSPSFAGAGEARSLRTLVNRVKQAAIHLRELGHLTDTDLGMADPPRAPRRKKSIDAMPRPIFPPERIDVKTARPSYYYPSPDIMREVNGRA